MASRRADVRHRLHGLDGLRLGRQLNGDRVRGQVAGRTLNVGEVGHRSIRAAGYAA